MELDMPINAHNVLKDHLQGFDKQKEIELYIHAEKMHLFDPATGENLTVQKEKAGTLGQHAIDEESTKTT